MDIRAIVMVCAWTLLCVQMGVYIHYKLRGKGRAYTLSKCAGSAIFTLTGLGALTRAPIDGYVLLMLCGAVLSFVGDYFLAQPQGHHRLRWGAAAFAIAHCFFMTAFIVEGGFHWQIIPFAALVFMLELLGARAIKLNFRGAAKGAALYILTVTVMAAMACSLLFLDVMEPTAAWMTAIGAVLFLVSDIVWMLYGLDKNLPNKVFKAINVVTYFPAVLLMMSALYYR